jgi:membrane protein YdbS with pleckstrin-like domain
MAFNTGYRRRSAVGRIVGVVVLVWLLIGALAAGQRHYYSSAKTNCAGFGTIAVTILAGPLNYVGANPKVKCHVPEPSK